MSIRDALHPAEGTIDVLAEIREELKELPFLREELEVLAEIRDALQTHNAQVKRISKRLGRIADSLPIPFVPVVPDEAKDAGHVMVKRPKLDEALGLVRLVLDTGGPGLPGSPNAGRLFEVEAILSRELGNPIWEGRRG